MATKKTPSALDLRAAFVEVQIELEQKLRRASNSIQHPSSQGDVNEAHWIEVFRAYLPDRYQVSKGIVIDSKGSLSEQMDLIVFDRHYTPTLLNQQQHRYVPVEAVYAIFECKPVIDKAELEYAGKKAASVRQLHRTSVAIAHAGGTYPAKALFPIVAGILAAKTDWSEGLGASFRERLPSYFPSRLDCGCALADGAFDSYSDELLIVPADGALIYFLFRLLSKLQSLGTVPAIDWVAYARTINPSAA
jgi:hypothetical protein